MIYSGRIVSVEKKVNTITYIETGIGQSQQYEYENNPRFKGGNGTYCVGGDYLGTEIVFKIFIFDLGNCVKFDLRDYILQLNNKERISQKLLNFIIDYNQGKKIELLRNPNGSFTFDINQLNLKM